MILCHTTDIHKDQYLYSLYIVHWSSSTFTIFSWAYQELLVLHCVKICYFKQLWPFTLHVRLMTTGNKDEYIVALTRNNLKNIAIDLCTMTSCNFMAFQSPYYSYLVPLWCKAEMALNRLLLRKVIQEPNMYLGDNTIIIFFDNDIEVSYLPTFQVDLIQADLSTNQVTYLPIFWDLFFLRFN